MKRRTKGIIAYGYVKEEDGIYTAICVNMGLFGQGKTPEQALKKVIKAVLSYVTYVFEEHPDKSEKFLNRPAPANYVEEYNQGIKSLRIESLKKRTQPKENQLRQPYKSFIPVRTFAEEVSYAQAQ